MAKPRFSQYRGSYLTPPVHETYFHPVAEFHPQTMWSFPNAFTWAFGELAVPASSEAAAKLATFLRVAHYPLNQKDRAWPSFLPCRSGLALVKAV